MQSAAFSSDGTILAVAAGDLITLWNPSTNGLIHVLQRSVVHVIS
jgi:NET1-associated nuclear protein 1 (U3 small nucleolar RNA-associated protein 17)